MAANSVWGKSTICVVTGASQNIGRCLAERFAGKLGPNSVLVLTSRSKQRLATTEKAIADAHKDLKVHAVQWDFSSPDSSQYERDLKSAVGAQKFDVALIIHNAAALGDMGMRVSAMNDVSVLRHQLDVNLVSTLALNSTFLKLFKDAKTKLVVNMTAPSATTPRSSFAMTSMVKSSRQILFNILAIEEPDVKVLQYDPGAVDTESLRAIRDTSHEPAIRDWIKGFYDRDEVLTDISVVDALADVIAKNEYKSGSYVGAYDVVKP